MQTKFKVSPFENKTLSWWYARRDKIDMNPPYQRRGKLWSDTDKAYLVDSILNGYDIPKIYVADFNWRNSDLNKKRLPYAIIDGKQRFEAIFDFFSGNIVLNDNFVYLENPKLKLGGLGYSDIKKNHKDIAEEFETFNLMVMSVYAENDDPINELFVRLNRSKALTGAEIRNAMSGPVPIIIRQITEHKFFSSNVKFNVKRGQDLNAATKLVFFEYNNGFQETKKKDLDNFVDDVANETREKIELSARHVLDILSDMAEIFLPKDNLLNSAGILPVYFWFIRGLEEKYYRFVRKFFVYFESKRKENRRLIRLSASSDQIELLFVEYDNFNRSTNNQQSHEERFRILKESFFSWNKSEMIHMTVRDLIIHHLDGTYEPRQPIAITSQGRKVTLSPGVRFRPGVRFNGVDITEVLDMEVVN